MKKTTTLGLTSLLLATPTLYAQPSQSTTEAIKGSQSKILKHVSADMKEIMQKLENDWDFIGEFLDNPQQTVAKYDLTEKEIEALSTRNINDLMSLGYSEEEVVVAMSGTHRGGGSHVGK